MADVWFELLKCERNVLIFCVNSLNILFGASVQVLINANI